MPTEPTQTFIDTQFVVALANRRDAHHAETQEIAREYLGRNLVTTDAVLLETGNGLARGLRNGAAAIIQAFREMDGVEVVNMTPDLFDRALALYSSRLDKEWGLVDCLSFVVMKERKMTDALTYDKHFVQAGYTAIMRHD
jgi:uncharacterized protein